MKPISLLYLALFGAALMFAGCGKDDCNGKEACCEEPDPGNCFAAIPRYYFDQDAGECREFIWGGCEGTVPFESLQECEACDCGK